MRLSVSGFTHIGTFKRQNEDRILVHDHIINSQQFEADYVMPAHFFVADGVGGKPAGDIAATFVLSRLKDYFSSKFYDDNDQLFSLLHSINRELLDYSALNHDYEGMATTLVGITFQNNQFRIISAGDSQVFIFRNSKLTKLTHEPVFGEPGGNCPITSYFGGGISSLNLDVSAGHDPVYPGDVFLVASDGIFKALTIGQIEKILSSSKPLKEKTGFILFKALQIGSPDNISCIFINVN